MTLVKAKENKNKNKKEQKQQQKNVLDRKKGIDLNKRIYIWTCKDG